MKKRIPSLFLIGIFLTTSFTVTTTTGNKISSSETNDGKCDLHIYAPSIKPILRRYVKIYTKVFYENDDGPDKAPPIRKRFSVAFFYNQDTENPFKILNNVYFRRKPSLNFLSEEVSVQFFINLPKGVTKITAKVDYYDDIDEANEENNWSISDPLLLKIVTFAIFPHLYLKIKNLFSF
jgi:hypothetical protein